MKYVFPIAVLPSRILRGTQPESAIQDWRTSKQFTIAVAEAMPSEKYDFRVNSEEMSFGDLMAHIAVSQAFRFAQISGSRAFSLPAPGTHIDKATAIRLLTDSFDFCIGRLGALTPEQLHKSYKVDWYERPQITGEELVLGMLVHTAHHRAQAEVYLRANNIQPPRYRF